MSFLLNSRRQLAITLVLSLLSLIFFQISTADLTVQHWLYLNDNHTWLWDKHEKVARFFLYDGPKMLLIAFAVTLLCSVAASIWLASLKRYRRDMLLVLATLALVPLIIGGLKTLTNIPCPRNLDIFGGTWEYASILSHFTSQQIPWSGQRCFPASHAGSFFALLSLVAVCRHPRNQKMVFILVLTLGWIMGVYKMAIGDHFLSHTVISMLLAWGTVHTLLVIEAIWWPKAQDQHHDGLRHNRGFPGA